MRTIYISKPRTIEKHALKRKVESREEVKYGRSLVFLGEGRKGKVMIIAGNFVLGVQEIWREQTTYSHG